MAEQQATESTLLGKRAREIDALDFKAHQNGSSATATTEDTEEQEQGPPPLAAGAIDDDDSDDDDDDFGPMPLPAEESAVMTKKRKTLPHAQLYLDHLPSADRYYKSFMHRDTVNCVKVTKTNFLLTTSLDGHLKFWKKQAGGGIEFVKHYRTHLSPIVGLAVDDEGKNAASIGEDVGGKCVQGGEVRGSVKVFEVENFDMINIIKLPYAPRVCAWIHGRGDGRVLLAVSDFASPLIRIYDGRGDGTPLHTIEGLHRSSVHLMEYNPHYHAVISIDISGMIEYWTPDEPFEKPGNVEWDNKGQTGLYEFKKTKSTPISLTLSPTGTSFAILSLPHLRLTVFSFPTGRLVRAYDESLVATQEMQQAGTLPTGVHLDSMEFGRRLAGEKELERLALEEVVGGRPGVGVGKPAWDEGGNFVIYPTLLGIKVVNTVTNTVARMLGKDETVRFLDLSLFQGLPIKKGIKTIAMATSDNPLLADKDERDPTLFCTAYKRPRFYLFTREHPDEKAHDRDVFNEKPTRDEMTIAAPSSAAQGPSGRKAVIHTTKGDIAFDLFPDQTPKTVENFVGLSRKHYYDEVIFHRVIPKFMLQTGDPLGDGTGGESLWGSSFEDEIHPSLKHDRPYTLSMANAGPKTNGSQFFITTVPAPWLDGKHTVFGRATSGFDVIHEIENVRTDKGDRPYDEIRIVSVDVE